MSENWTPWPWTVSIDGRGYVDQIVSAAVPEYRPVTRRHSLITPALPEGKANAHLIAAAPDLYEALAALVSPGDGGGFVSALEELERILPKARAALKKARGE